MKTFKKHHEEMYGSSVVVKTENILKVLAHTTMSIDDYDVDALIINAALFEVDDLRVWQDVILFGEETICRACLEEMDLLVSTHTPEVG